MDFRAYAFMAGYMNKEAGPSPGIPEGLLGNPDGMTSYDVDSFPLPTPAPTPAPVAKSKTPVAKSKTTTDDNKNPFYTAGRNFRRTGETLLKAPKIIRRGVKKNINANINAAKSFVRGVRK